MANVTTHARSEVVFLGPSLSREEAESIRPGALVLPPAGLGDVMSVARTMTPRAIVLIDGKFHSHMSVFHKELLYALDLGVWVIGASSIGALRAAECERFGGTSERMITLWPRRFAPIPRRKPARPPPITRTSV